MPTTNTINAKVAVRYDTEANWQLRDTLLLAGEIAVSSDKQGMFKVGDGEHGWLELAYNKAARASSADFSTSSTGTTNDKNGNDIYATYVSNISMSGNTISMTKNGTTTEVGTVVIPEVEFDNFTGATSQAAGASGLVPAPGIGDNTNKFLKADGTWAVTPDTVIPDFTGATNSSDGVHGLVPAPDTGEEGKFLKADGTWGVPTNTTYSVMTAADILTDGAAGLVPAPSASATSKYLSNRGTWDTVQPSTMTGATNVSNGASGLVTQPIAGDQDKYLKGDGTWGTPPNTTYSAATDTTAGLVKIYTGTGNNTDGTMTQDAITGALSGKAASSHTHASADITSLDASKLTGKISMDRLPEGALERIIVVADDTARFALTAEDAQLGDTVKVTDTGLMYFVKALPADEEDPMNAETYFEPYTASAASSVPWSGVTGKPSTFAPSSHSHAISDITNLETTLSGKAASSHEHSAADITSGTLNASRLPDSGVTAGTYKSVTVDSTGRVTAGSNPTTLAGYGITDASASGHGHVISDVTGLQDALDGKAASTHTHNYFSPSGGTINGNVTIKGATSNANSFSSTNPKIIFTNSDETQSLALIFTDYDAIADPGSLTLIGDQGGEYLIVPNLKVTGTIYENGQSLASKYQAAGNYAGSASNGGSATSAVKLDTARVIEGLSFDGTANRVAYGACSTGSASSAKTVDCAGYSLITGSQITVKFTNDVTTNDTTLNVNNTGAKYIYYNGSVIDPNVIVAGSTHTFRYNGTQYDLVGSTAATSSSSSSDFVTQTISNNNNAEYRVLMSVTADDTTRSEGTRKDTNFRFNPSLDTLYVTNIVCAADFGDPEEYTPPVEPEPEPEPEPEDEGGGE